MQTARLPASFAPSPAETSPQLSPRVLIIEDDPTLSELVAGQLRSYGYLARQCFDGRSGLTTAVAESFNLILLDVLLPKMDGFAVLNKLRKQSDTPVIMLTACGAEEDRITGFRSGADDYLAKPFNVTELMLRIDAVLRRSQRSEESRGVVRQTQIQCEGLLLDARMQSAAYQEHTLELTQIEFRLLWLLLENREQVLSKPYLYQELLGRAYSRHERSLDMHVSKLRRKLAAVECVAGKIQTVHGQGYSFR